MSDLRPTLLVVDDEPDVIYSFRRLFEKEYSMIEAHSGEEAVQLVQGHDPDVVVMDVRMQGMDGVEALRRIRQVSPRTIIVLMTAYGTTQSTIEAMRLGAFDYILKPFDITQMREVLAKASRAAADMRRTVSYPSGGEGTDIAEEEIIGLSAPMQEVYKLVGRVADSDLPVLIAGESGTGKELVARAIYQHSRRKNKPFLAINCAAIPEQLLESELFGYERGAFTGASVPKPGKLEICHGGTIFLDEIGEIPLTTQKKLLRVLETGEIEKVGSTRGIRVDVRIIAATNQDLESLIAQNLFRADLYYRLRVVEIRMPPLRERREDIVPLVDYFVTRVARQLRREKPEFTRDALELLHNYSWPGNVRELENLIKNCFVRIPTNLIRASDLAGLLTQPIAPAASHTKAEHVVRSARKCATVCDEATIRALFEQILASQPLPPGFDAFDLIEQQLLKLALIHCHGNKSRAARLLGISRNTVRKRVKKYGLTELTDGEA
ncbi:MAG: sigma-54-dependent transcriptional regulator [Candidatus Sumerlaeaceae bacterium]